MPQKAPISDSRTPRANVKSPMDSLAVPVQPQMRSSASFKTTLLGKKQPLQYRLNHHPYQSSHPGNNRLDLNIAARDNLSSFTQRVMSAKLLRLKQLQNQLAEAHLQLNELYSENRLLRSLQKRQDLALDRYEGSQAQLPQLVRSHQEEVRVLRSKYKNLKLDYRNTTKTLKEREAELQNLKEQHAHLLKLSKDRHLGDRESLSKQVEELKSTVNSHASTIQVLNRKLLLETKNLKFQLQQEMQRHKATQSDLQQTFMKMDQLQMQLDQAKERNVLPLPTDHHIGKTASASKLAGIVKGLTVNQNSVQIYKSKKPNKERMMQISANNSNQSSGQPDSSPATYSEKANELSTSLDSSPEHTTHGLRTSNSGLPLVQQSDSYRFQRSILQKSATDFDISLGLSKDLRIPESDIIGSNPLSNEVLEEEYENAVAMLSELSTKHKGRFEEDISSLDMASAKHASFATKSESQSSSDEKSKLDELSSLLRLSKKNDEDNSFCTVKSQQSSVPKDKNHTKANKISPGFGIEVGSRKFSNHMVENNLQPSECPGNVTSKADSFSQKKINHSGPQFSGACGDGEIDNKKADEKLEISCKEALLKALKAIDESSDRGSESDNSDTAAPKATNISSGSQRVFSSSNSSGIGVVDDLKLRRRRKPLK